MKITAETKVENDTHSSTVPDRNTGARGGEPFDLQQSGGSARRSAEQR